MATVIEAWRSQNAGRMMFAAADQFVSDSLRPAHQHGYAAVGVVLQALVKHLDLEGTRLTELAGRAGMSKASMMELVNKTQELGLVERHPDPADGRAKIVSFTAQGLRMLDYQRKGVAQAERRMAQAVGQPFAAAMKQQLKLYAAAPSIPRPAVTGGAAWRTANSGCLLLSATDRFVGDILHVVQAGGFPGITPVLLSVFRHIDRDGTRLTELAARAGLTKQAMAELVQKVAALGLTSKRDDPADQRAKIILLTASGHAALDRAREGVEYAEAEMARVTRPRFVPELVAQLRVYVAGAAPATTALPR